MNYQWNGWQGSRISGTVRRPSIRSAEAEERRRGHGVADAGSAFRAPDRTREPGRALTNIDSPVKSHFSKNSKKAPKKTGPRIAYNRFLFSGKVF